MNNVGRGLTCLACLVLASVVRADEPRPVPAPPPPPRPAKVEDFAPAEEFVQVGAVKTHVVRRGDKGPAVVLIHGFGSSTHTWRFNMEALAKTCRVFAVDVKGFGLTEKPRDGRYFLAEYADHLVQTLDVLKIDRAVLVGNSMGGAIIARVALLHPERVSGLILVDAAPPGWTPPSAASAPSPMQSLTDRFKVALAKTLVSRKALESGLKVAYHDPKFITPEVVEAHYRPFTIDGAAEALIAMTNPPRDSRPATPPLSDLKAPALIVWGRHDRVIPVSVADFFAKQLPKAAKAIFEKSGHLPHEEESERFNDLATRFVAGLP